MSGQFYIVDSKTLFIEDFNYDGGGPGKLAMDFCYHAWSSFLKALLTNSISNFNIIELASQIMSKMKQLDVDIATQCFIKYKA